MKMFFTLNALLYFQFAYSQHTNSMIIAEKAFAQYASDVNTKEAFLKFMDDSAVVFVKGVTANARKVWEANKVSSVKLLWAPAFAGIASSGDLGFTTGPYEVKRSLQDTAFAAGEFTTIWKLTDKKEWKFLIDLGTGFNGKAYPVNKTKLLPVATKVKNIKTSEIPDIETDFINKLKVNGINEWKEVISKNAWLINDGAQPFIYQTQHGQAIQGIPTDLIMTPTGWGISKAGDMIYVYGNTQHQDKRENYLRVWQLSGHTWKIVMQVLKW